MNKEQKTCYNCVHFNSQSAQADQPYSEFWCGKKHWDGLSNFEQLYEEIDCNDFESKLRKELEERHQTFKNYYQK